MRAAKKEAAVSAEGTGSAVVAGGHSGKASASDSGNGRGRQRRRKHTTINQKAAGYDSDRNDSGGSDGGADSSRGGSRRNGGDVYDKQHYVRRRGVRIQS